MPFGVRRPWATRRALPVAGSISITLPRSATWVGEDLPPGSTAVASVASSRPSLSASPKANSWKFAVTSQSVETAT